MGNIQGVWIMYVTVLCLNSLIADEKTRDIGLWRLLNGTNLYILKMSQLQNGSQKICCVREEVMLLFPKKMKVCGFIQD